MAHLYEGCRQAGYPKQIWSDMELVMDIHTHEKIFLGHVPHTPAESLKCIKLIKEIFLSSNSPVTTIFGQQWMTTGDAMLTIDTMDNLLNGPNYEPTSTIAARTKIRACCTVNGMTHKLTPLQFLDTLHRGLAAEEYMLRFDYISLHFRCLRLLRTLRTVFDDMLRRFFGRNYIERDTRLHLLVSTIFIMAAESEDIIETRNQKPEL
jgi:hypothetical protein